MKIPLNKKSSIQTIEKRFDNDVERFANLETGQQAIIDAPWMLDLIAKTSIRAVPDAQNILDIGCGAGNNTIKIVREKPLLNCDLVDLSSPMLECAKKRLEAEDTGTIRTFQGDFRNLELPKKQYDIIVAAAVLHHLRDEYDWQEGFKKIYALLKPGGALLVSDMFFHDDEAVHNVMWQLYRDYLQILGGEDYAEKVLDYIDCEDSPRSLTYQIGLLKEVGFTEIDVLHKNSCFGAYIAIK